MTVRFRNSKEHSLTLDWLVKSASYLPASSSSDSLLSHSASASASAFTEVSASDAEAVRSLQHEIRVYSGLLAEVHRFLQGRKNARAKFLLNMPEFVFQVIVTKARHCQFVFGDEVTGC